MKAEMTKLLATHVGFMVDKVALVQAFVQTLGLFSVSIVPLVVHIAISFINH